MLSRFFYVHVWLSDAFFGLHDLSHIDPDRCSSMFVDSLPFSYIRVSIAKRTLSQDRHHDLRIEKLIWTNCFPASLRSKLSSWVIWCFDCNDNQNLSRKISISMSLVSRNHARKKGFEALVWQTAHQTKPNSKETTGELHTGACEWSWSKTLYDLAFFLIQICTLCLDELLNTYSPSTTLL